MSITDELREWTRTNTINCSDNRIALVGIAERIDAAMEDYIELPKDADGETIHIGERVQLIGNDPSTVSHMSLADDGWRVFVKYDGNLGTGSSKPKCIHHVQPDSWERIIRDAQGDGILNQIDGRPSDFDALVERCKRLAELVGSTKKNVGEGA